jgi:hypothetical protein
MYAVAAAPQAKKPLYCKSHEKKAPAFRMPKLVATIEDLVAPIEDGCVLVVPREVSGVPMEATRALIRRGVKELELIALPTAWASSGRRRVSPPR